MSDSAINRFLDAFKAYRAAADPKRPMMSKGEFAAFIGKVPHLFRDEIVEAAHVWRQFQTEEPVDER